MADRRAFQVHQRPLFHVPIDSDLEEGEAEEEREDIRTPARSIVSLDLLSENTDFIKFE